MTEIMNLSEIYGGKKVLVTGHTGFKGSWLTLWLKHLGAQVTGVSLSVPTRPSHFEVAGIANLIDDRRLDIRDINALQKLIFEVKPDFVFHLAAQALVRPSYESPLETLVTNAIGSANLLESLRIMDSPVTAVMITSDKAYENQEWVWGYRETDRLGGKDPYSASKAMAEMAIHTFVESYFRKPGSGVRVGIARAGNVIGGGDWAVDRIVPDCMRAWSQGDAVDIRSPFATRPWQHVLEPLSGYLLLGAELSRSARFHGEAFNFGPPAHQNHSVSELINEMGKYWSSVRWNDVSNLDEHVHEAGLLKLSCDKALFSLKWQPTLQFHETVKMTVEWYRTFYESQSKSMHELTLKQIEVYTVLAMARRSAGDFRIPHDV